MNILVFSYSHTGNNEVLAVSLASKLNAEHIRITEPKKRTILTFILDVLFNRTPKVIPKASEIADKIKDNVLVLFVGPVWFGQVATPFRPYLKELKTKLNKYAFVSISGGAAGPNPNLAVELKKRIGKLPTAVINLYIADLLPHNPKPTMKDTSSYHINDKEVESLTNTVLKTLREYELR